MLTWHADAARHVVVCVRRVTCANPGTEPVAETAAAMAAGFLAFNASGEQQPRGGSERGREEGSDAPAC